MSAGIPPHLVAEVVLAVLCVVSAALALRSWPISMRRALRVALDRVEAAEANVDACTAKVATRLVELAALIEEAEGVLGAVERKRRRVAAQTKHDEAAERLHPGDPDPDAPLLELKRRARAAGYPV